MKRARVLVVGAAAVFGLVGIGPLGGAAAVRAAAGEPTVDSVLAAATKAVGGQEALDKVKTLRVATTVERGGTPVELETWWSRGGGRLLKSPTPMGDVVMGTDGTTTWTKAPTGYALTAEDQAGGLRANADLYMRMVDFQKIARGDMSKLEVAGKEKFAEHECIGLAFTKKKGGDGTIYFDAESGMPVGVVSTNGAVKSTNIFGDWRVVEGVKFFHSVKTQTEGGRGAGASEMKVKTLEVNTLKDSDFALPEEVKKLAAEKKAEPAAGGTIALEDLPEDQRAGAKKAVDGYRQMSLDQLKSIELGLQKMSEADTKNLSVKYMMQELKAEIKKRGS